MRIVIDMQGAQSVQSRDRGIGRYTIAITKALIRNRGKHRIVLALNGNFPETITPLRAAFEGMLPAGDIRVWQSPVPVSYTDTANQWRRNVAELLYESFLASLKPDFVYITSLFENFTVDSVTSVHRLLQNTPVAVTLYDLIPYLYPEPYLEEPIAKEWYLEKLEYLQKADLWFAISESSRQDGMTQLGLSDEWTVNIGADADAFFQITPITENREITLRKKYGLSKPFLMCTGGYDYRKNVEVLIRAFAMLPQSLQKTYQLVIVTPLQIYRKEMLLNLIKKQGLNEQDVVLVGFVPDDDLLLLYNLCELFVFPSWYEGFGLPALEAMRCGVPVIGANTSSLPEVIGWEEALFDPHSDAEIARAIERGLIDEPFRQALLKNSEKQAGQFSWDCSARRAITAMERRREQWERDVSLQKTKRPKLAYVSPLCPIRSGISDYSAELLPELNKFYDIDIVVEQDDVADPWIDRNCMVRTSQQLRQNARQYDRVLYHFGNSEFHQHMFKLLEDVPGVVVLHDFFLSGVLAYMEFNNLEANAWRKSLYESHGHAALREHQQAEDLAEVIWKYPCSLGVIQNALGVIVHSENSLRLASRWYAADVSDWSIIPLVRDTLQIYNKDEAREALGLKKDDFLVCSFGMVGPTKLNHRLLQAWQQSSLSEKSSCHLIFVGENHPGDYGQSLLKTIKMHQKDSRICITDWVDLAEFRRYLAAADVCVQLRTLSRGETSAATMDCMNYGKPTIVNANGSMADINPDAVWMLQDEFTNMELIKALEKLYQDAPLRQHLGETARDIIMTQHNPAACSMQYHSAIESCYRHSEGNISVLSKVIATQAGIADEKQLIPLASAIAQNIPLSCKPWQLLVDVTQPMDPAEEYALMPQLKAWLEFPPYGCRVEPVYMSEDGQYFYARSFSAGFFGYTEILQDEPIEYRIGDVLMGRELTSKSSVLKKKLYDDFYQQGVALRVLPKKGGILRHEYRIESGLAEILARLDSNNRLNFFGRQLFIDVSELIRLDLKSGIQRFARSVLYQLSCNPPCGVRIEPVYSVPGHQGYFYVRHIFGSNNNIPSRLWGDGTIEFSKGDIFFAVELNHHVVASNREFYKKMREHGARVIFCVHDILPVQFPGFFAKDMFEYHSAWLKAVAQCDGAVCVSQTVASDLKEWLMEKSFLHSNFKIDWSHHGADIVGSIPSKGVPDDAGLILSRLSENTTFLMVGTLEPRKGHQQVFAAFDLLWAKGMCINLAIVGKKGWMMDELAEAILKHKELENHLFWIDDASDEYLESIYEVSDCLIAASEGEGFGMPIIEAARHEMPIIARDISVFREVAGNNAVYFSGKNTDDLACVIEEWICLYEQGNIPDPKGVAWLTWKESVELLIEKIMSI